MVFVGRQSELDRFHAILQSVETGTVLDLVGIHGVGKTMLLDQFVHQARRYPDVLVFKIDLWEYRLGEGFTDDFGPNASTDVLFETFQRSLKLVTLFTAQAGDDDEDMFSSLRLAHKEHLQLHELLLANRSGSLGRRSSTEAARPEPSQSLPAAEGSADSHNIIIESNLTNAVQARYIRSVVINQTLSNDETRVVLRALQNIADDVFVEAWSDFTARRRVLIAVDGFETVADDELGLWMTRLASRLPRTLLVLARTPSTRRIVFRQNQFQQFALGNFGVPEVAEYLASRLDPEPVQPGLAEVTHTATAGHPGGVSLVAELITETEGAAMTPAGLQRRLNRLPDDWERRWAALVDLILETTNKNNENKNNEKLRLAVEAAAVVATFDDTLLGKLVGADGANSTESTALIRRLDGLRLLQQLPWDGPSPRLRLLEFVRRSVAASLQEFHYGERWLPLHKIAAEHYYGFLNDWDGGAFDSYQSWYVFEDPEWQENKRSWLWHTGMLADRRSRKIARARLTRVFLMAWWWWGTYLPFPFNRQLLEDWGRATAIWERRHRPPGGRTEDQQLIDALTFLLDNYPVSYLKQPADAPWDDIQGRMLLVRALCGLGAGVRPIRLTPAEATDLAWADALITLVLAHTRRFRDPADPEGEELYEQAINTFAALGDKWTVLWLKFEQADLAYEMADRAEAIRRMAATAAAIRDAVEATKAIGDWDHELLGNVHRLAADLLWQRGELTQSGTEYGRAVTHAYQFQNVPNPPDEYTQQFYAEITTRAAQRLIELAGRPTDTDLFMTGLGTHIPMAGAPAAALDQDISEIKRRLFPRGPAMEELRDHDTEFLTTWRTSPLSHVDPVPGLSYVAGLSDGLSDIAES